MKPGRFIAGLLLILLGTAFFMASLGYGSWRLIRLLPVIGPVLLIILGFSLLWKGNIPRGIAFTVVILATGAVIALFLINPEPASWHVGESKLLVSPSDYPELTAGELDLDFGAGKLSIESTIGNWAEGRFRGFPAVSTVTESGKKLKLKISPKDEELKNFWFNRGKNAWKLNLSPQLYWEVLIKSGAVKGELNLMGIPLRRLDLNLGAGDMEIRLGGNGGDTKVKVEAGVSSLKIFIPESTGLKVSLDGALTKTNLEELGLLPVNKRYVSENYETAGERVDLELDIAVSKLEIKRIPVGEMK